MVIAMSEPLSPPVRSGPHGNSTAPGGRLRAAESPGATQDSRATQRFSLALQAECAQRELARRHRVYAGLARSGRMSADEAAREIDLMRAIRDTLRVFAEHEAKLREVLTAEISQRRRRAEAEELRASEPAVDALLSRFPDATLAATPEPSAPGGRLPARQSPGASEEEPDALPVSANEDEVPA